MEINCVLIIINYYYFYLTTFSSGHLQLVQALKNDLKKKDLQLEMKDIEIESHKKQVQSLMMKICDPNLEETRTEIKPDPEQIELIEEQQEMIEKLKLQLQKKEEHISNLQKENNFLKIKQEASSNCYVEETIHLDSHLEDENKSLKDQLKEEKEKFESLKKDLEEAKKSKANQVDSETQTETMKNFETNVEHHNLEFDGKFQMDKSPIYHQNEKILKSRKRKRKLEIKTESSGNESKRLKQEIVEKAETGLKDLKVQFTDLPHKVLVKIINYLPTKTIVRDLSLVSKQLNDLSKNPSVQIQVRLSSEINPESFQNIFQRSSQIESLELKTLKSSEGIKILTNHAEKLSSLTKLCIISSETIPKKLLENLFKSKSLKYLTILCYNLEDFSLETISHCKQLKKLMLSTRSIYKLSEKEFKALASPSKLNYIDFYTFKLNFIPKEEVREFPINQNCQGYFTLHIDAEDNGIAHPHLKFLISHFPKISLSISGIKVDMDNQENIEALNSLSSSSFKNGYIRLDFNCKTIPKSSSLNQLTGWSYNMFDSKNLFLKKKNF